MARHRIPVGWRGAHALTVTEAAAVAGLSRSRFYELTGHAVPTIRDHRGRQRVRVSDLLRFMERHHIAASDEPQPDLFSASELEVQL